MGKYLHLFDTEVEFDAVYNNDETYYEPWVSLTLDSDRVDYNKTESIEPLTFKITSPGLVRWNLDVDYDSSSLRFLTEGQRTIEYSLNGGDWTSITSNTGDSAPSISVTEGDILKFRGNNDTYYGGYYYYEDVYEEYRSVFSGTTAGFELEGNIMSLITSTGYETLVEMTEDNNYVFASLFAGCTGLTSAGNLILPATTLADSCYEVMFEGCTSLTKAPELPATTLADDCYHDMFTHCTSLTQAPELPATTLANSCYNSMFRGCTNLTTAPELPAETLAHGCYYFMFSNCTSLTQAPELPATTLTEVCYASMFQGCTSLTQTPELPTTTLTRSCYSYMFAGCTSLTEAPELPATTLAQACYYYMFQGCTGLTQAPELPATTLADYCYYDMFYNCTNLNYVKCLATDISASNCTYYWLYGVSPTGTFVKDANMTSWTTGNSGIPNGWTVEDA